MVRDGVAADRELCVPPPTSAPELEAHRLGAKRLQGLSPLVRASATPDFLMRRKHDC